MPVRNRNIDSLGAHLELVLLEQKAREGVGCAPERASLQLSRSGMALGERRNAGACVWQF